MLQYLRRAIWVSAIFTGIRFLYWVVDAIGNLQTAKELIPRMPEAAQFVVMVLYWPLTGPLVCIVCLIALAALDRRRASHRQLDISTMPSRDSANRVIVDVTPDYLMGLFDQHTSVQAQKLIEPYIGKWIRVSGRLHDVSDDD